MWRSGELLPSIGQVCLERLCLDAFEPVRAYTSDPKKTNHPNSMSLTPDIGLQTVSIKKKDTDIHPHGPTTQRRSFQPGRCDLWSTHPSDRQSPPQPLEAGAQRADCGLGEGSSYGWFPLRQSLGSFRFSFTYRSKTRTHERRAQNRALVKVSKGQSPCHK